MFLLRQAFVLACVKTGEVIVIDILALRTPLFFKTFGWFTTLMIVQARGWPFVLTFWSVADFCCLYGSHRVSKNQIRRYCLPSQSARHIFTIITPSSQHLAHAGIVCKSLAVLARRNRFVQRKVGACSRRWHGYEHNIQSFLTSSSFACCQNATSPLVLVGITLH